MAKRALPRPGSGMQWRRAPPRLHAAWVCEKGCAHFCSARQAGHAETMACHRLMQGKLARATPHEQRPQSRAHFRAAGIAVHAPRPSHSPPKLLMSIPLMLAPACRARNRGTNRSLRHRGHGVPGEKRAVAPRTEHWQQFTGIRAWQTVCQPGILPSSRAFPTATTKAKRAVRVPPPLCAATTKAPRQEVSHTAPDCLRKSSGTHARGGARPRTPSTCPGRRPPHQGSVS